MLVGFQQSLAPMSSDGAEVRNQISGYWVSDPNELPSEPSYIPTGALLLSGQQDAETPAEGLDLVNIDGDWRPLSHAAVLTYIHSSGLARGETWYFVTFDRERRTVYECQPPLGEIEADDIRQRFGAIASGRARSDWPTILLRIRRLDGSVKDRP